MDIYSPRLIRHHAVTEVSGIRFKPYSIVAGGREAIDIDTVLRHAATALATSRVPALAHSDLGYVVFHAGEMANWLLVRTWLEGGIVSGLLGRIEGDRYEAVGEPLIECVWEEIPVHHERGAWVRHMMKAQPRPDGYLQDWLADGYH